jgi:hypothetical protein
MRHSLILVVICSFISGNAHAQIADYIYPHFSQPTYSNYGTVGLIQMPSARMHPGGTVGFTWTHADPYLRGSIMGHPFDWFEASYQYTDVNNFLYSDSPEFSGTQSYKDKSFDAKFRLIKERQLIPQVAVGFRDFGGSALFASEYIVASKLIGNIDFTLGVGFGTISNRNISNPLAKIAPRFESRERAIIADSQGGDINYGKFFGGKEAGLFGGVEIFLPKLKGTRLKIEYDTTNYAGAPDGGEGYLPVIQDGKFNYSFIYPITKNFHVKLGYIRNNTLSFGFSIAGNYSGRSSSLISKTNPPPKIDNAEIYQKVVNAEKAENLYKSSLKILRDNNLYLQSANVDNNRYEITFVQSKYLNNAQALGRMTHILNEISPDVIEEFSLSTINADQSLFAVDIPRAGYNLYKVGKKTDALLEEVRIYKPDPKQHLKHDYRPRRKLPTTIYKISPAIRSQIGGPDGFYFGDLSLSIHSETLIKRNFNILGVASIGLINNFDELKLASDSILPHVRTDIVSYLKESKKSHITRLQANYFGNPYKSIYTKISAGIFEPMFAGYGGEVLYKPFGQSFGIGAELWHVRQRSFRQLLSFRDYETITGHMNFYYREPRSRVLFHLRGGRYLAKDSGVTFNLSRDFSSGLNMGVFFSITDISKAEFGEGSFDKGFFFNLPIQVFFQEYSRGQTGFGLRPLTRDGAQFLVHAQNLWGTTYQASKAQIENEWEGFYD